MLNALKEQPKSVEKPEGVAKMDGARLGLFVNRTAR